jgi:DnaJ-domain-containing protein 1
VFLLDTILLSPLKGVVWLGRKISDVADQELNDVGRVKEELMMLQMQLELDEITEQEYAEKEQDLLDRLDRLSGSPEEGQAE